MSRIGAESDQTAFLIAAGVQYREDQPEDIRDVWTYPEWSFYYPWRYLPKGSPEAIIARALIHAGDCFILECCRVRDSHFKNGQFELADPQLVEKIKGWLDTY